MDAKTDPKLVSFDGGAGGVRTLSQLVTLRHVMHKLNLHLGGTSEVLLPCNHFDLMGGVDTGGLIVIMLVTLKMTVDEAIVEFVAIVEKVYAKALAPAARTESLRECVEDLLRRRGKPGDLKLEEQSSGCKGFVLAAGYNNIAHKACLRTYVGKDPSSGVTVVDAVLATCTTPPHFLPASFEVGPWTHRYVGDLAASNPVRHVIAEAQSIFGAESGASSILSLGSGNPGVIAFPPGDISEGLHKVALDMLHDCEKQANEIQSDIGRSGYYFRFSVDQGVQRDQPERDDRSWIRDQTSAYLANPDQVFRMEDYVNTVKYQSRSVTLDSSRVICTPGADSVPSVDNPVSKYSSSVGTAMDCELSPQCRGGYGL